HLAGDVASSPRLRGLASGRGTAPRAAASATALSAPGFSGLSDGRRSGTTSRGTSSTCSATGASTRSSACTASTGSARHGPAFAPRLRLIHPHHAVVVVGDRAEITRRPAVHECMGIDAGDAVLRHLLELEVREERQFSEEDRIEVGILWRTAAVGVEQRL